MLLVHGGPGLNLAIWEDFVPLVRDDFHVVAYDQRCNGLSGDGDDHHFDVFVDDLHDVVAGLGLDRPVVVGQSWGGWIALAYAARRDEAAAIVVADAPITYDMPPLTDEEWLEVDRWASADPVYTFSGTETEFENLLGELRRSRGYDRFDEGVARRNVRVDSTGRVRCRWTPAEYVRLDRAAFGDAIGRLDPDEIYPRIRCPVLLAGATEGVQAEPGRPFSRAAVEAVHARYPRLRVEWLAAGHCLPIEASAAFAGLVREFVAEALGEPDAAR